MVISVCVATTRPTTVGATLRSLSRQTYPGWEIVIVAQGDHEGVRRVCENALSSTPDRLRFVPQSGWGLSRARNAAIRAARGDAFAWLDDDCEAAPDWLEVLVDRFGRRPEVGLIGGALIAPRPRHRWPRTCPQWIPEETIFDPASHGRARPPGWGWIGGNFAIRRTAADRIGDFDEQLGAGAYFAMDEDVDFMLRAERLGVPTLATPRAVVHHTYGWRYGIRTVLRHQQNFARGAGALAGKLTLMGDPRGAQALAAVQQEARVGWVRRRRPLSLPTGLRRLYHFTKAYRECLTDFRVDGTGVLARRAASVSARAVA